MKRRELVDGILPETFEINLNSRGAARPPERIFIDEKKLHLSGYF